MAEYLIIDRIENGIASCEMEDRSMTMLPLSLLPEDVREGDVLLSRDGRYSIDRAETQRRRDYNKRLWDKINNK